MNPTPPNPSSLVFPPIAQRLRETIGLNLDAVTTLKVVAAIEEGCARCGLPTPGAYSRRLEESRLEWQEFVDRLLVPETWFFRHRDTFTFLDRYLRQQWLTESDRPVLRVLSIPCATGEEPYSLAITLLEAGCAPSKFRVEGIDLSQKGLRTAKNGIYTENSFREGMTAVEQGYFQPVSEGYRVSHRIRSAVSFKQGNLLDLREPQTYHLIFCRHLLIYLEAQARAKAIENLHHSLVDGGLLFVGTSETGLLKYPAWGMVDPRRGYLYQKRNLEKSVPPSEKSRLPLPKSEPVEESYLEKAKKLADRGHLLAAENFCRLYLQKDPICARAYLLLGEIERARGEIEKAEAHLQKALYLDPHCTDALIHLALLKECQGDYQGSIAMRRRLQRQLIVNSE